MSSKILRLKLRHWSEAFYAFLKKAHLYLLSHPQQGHLALLCHNSQCLWITFRVLQVIWAHPSLLGRLLWLHKSHVLHIPHSLSSVDHKVPHFNLLLKLFSYCTYLLFLFPIYRNPCISLYLCQFTQWMSLWLIYFICLFPPDYWADCPSNDPSEWSVVTMDGVCSNLNSSFSKLWVPFKSVPSAQHLPSPCLLYTLVLSHISSLFSSPQSQTFYACSLKKKLNSAIFLCDAAVLRWF